MQNVALSILIAGTAALAYFKAAPSQENSGPAEHTTVLPSAAAPDSEVLRTYLACSAEAELRVLSQSEVENCLDAYLRLKLFFLPDIDMDRYHDLSLEERWEANQEGYRAYVAWRSDARPSP